jgi:hypothetical protein
VYAPASTPKPQPNAVTTQPESFAGDHAGAEEDQNRRTDDLTEKYVSVAHGGS